MRQILFLVIGFPSVCAATDSFINEVHFSVTQVNFLYADYEKVSRAKFFGAGIKVDCFHNVNSSKKIYAGLGSSLFYGGSGDYSERTRSLGISVGVRDTDFTLGLFIDYELYANYSENWSKLRGPPEHVQEIYGNSFVPSVKIGKTIEVTHNNHIEASFGAGIGYTRNSQGAQTSVFGPNGSLSWNYLF